MVTLLTDQFKDVFGWKCHWKVEKYQDEKALIRELYLPGWELLVPDDVEEVDGNLLTYGGASCIWECLKGNGTATTAQTLTFFSNAEAYLGVGDSTTAAAATQTDLQAATNKLRVAMEATYPTHTDGTTDGSDDIVYRSSFSTAQANYAWEEIGTFNASTGGRMLNRKVSSLGTKTSAGTWVLTETLSLA